MVAVAVDVAIFTVLDRRLHILLAQVRHGLLAGRWGLPGGRVGATESLDAAASRQLHDQTGVTGIYLEQLYTFGSPDRDPAGRVVSVAYFGLIPHAGRFQPDGEAKYTHVRWQPVAHLPPLAYDHEEVVATALQRLCAKLEYTNLVYTLVPPAFALSELQDVYEAILARRLDRRNFRKKLLASGLLRPLGRKRRGAHRPAALFAFRHRRPMNIELL